MTDIHAKHPSKCTLTVHNSNDQPSTSQKNIANSVELKKQATEKIIAEKKRKEKRRLLKRL